MRRMLLTLAGMALLCALQGVSYSFELLYRAQAGDVQAQYDIGVCYDFGFGIYENDSEAVVWYRLAAMQMHREAQYILANCYDEGRGVERDPRQAFSWYSRAAQQGHPAAQFNLGVAYYNGEGVKQDYSQAYTWLLISATSGDPDAAKYLEPVGAQLTPQDRLAAQNSAAAWFREHQPEALAPPAEPSTPEAAASNVLLLQFAGAYDFPFSPLALRSVRERARVTLSDGGELIAGSDRVTLGERELTRVCLKRDGQIAINYGQPGQLSLGRLKKELRRVLTEQRAIQSLKGAKPRAGILIAAEDEQATRQLARLLKLAASLRPDALLLRRAGADPVRPD